MKIKACVALAAIIITLPSCAKNPVETARKEYRLAQNAALNAEVRALNEELKKATDDAARSDIHAKIAFIQNTKGDIAAATRSALAAVKYRPNQAMPHYLLGRSYIEAGRYNDAVAELETALKLNDRYAPAWFELGNAHYKKGDYPEAARRYEKAAALDVHHVMAHNNLGVLYSLLGKKRDAEKAFLAVVSLKPDYAPAHKNLGILYDTSLKNGPLAVKHYRAYLDLRPNCPERRLVAGWIKALGG